MVRFLPLFIVVTVLVLFSFSLAMAETATTTASYAIGDNDSKNDARRFCQLQAIRQVLDGVGIRVVNTASMVKSEASDGYHDSALMRTEAISGGIVQSTVLSEQFSNVNLTCTVRVEFDRERIASKLQMMTDNGELTRRVEAQQAQIDQMKRALVSTPNTAPVQNSYDQARAEVERLKAERQDMLRKIELIEPGMQPYEVLRILGKPDEGYTGPAGVATAYGFQREWRYGSIWVNFANTDNSVRCISNFSDQRCEGPAIKRGAW